MSDEHTLDPSGSDCTNSTTKLNNEQEVDTAPIAGKTGRLNNEVEVRKILRRSKTRGFAIRKTIEKLGISKRQATKLVDKVNKDLYDYNEYQKKEVRAHLIDDIEQKMELLENQMYDIEEEIEAAPSDLIGNLRWHLNQYVITYEKLAQQLHKFYPNAVVIEDVEDQRPTKIQINKIVVEFVQSDPEGSSVCSSDMSLSRLGILSNSKGRYLVPYYYLLREGDNS